MIARGVKVSVFAKRVGVHRSTVYEWIKQHRVPTIKIGPKSTRIPHADAERIARYGLPDDS